MPQYSLGSVTVTNGSSLVTASGGADWSDFLTGAAMFMLKGGNASYLVAQVRRPSQNASGKWELNLVGPFYGAPVNGPYLTNGYTLGNSFSPIYGLPLLNFGDQGGAQIFTRAILTIESLLKVINDTLVENSLRFLPNVHSLADLAGLVTFGEPTGAVRVYLDAATGRLRFFQLQAGTSVTNYAAGIARPIDYSQSNQRIWVDVLPGSNGSHVRRTFLKTFTITAREEFLRVGLNFAPLGAFDANDFDAVLTCSNPHVIILRNQAAQQTGSRTGWLVYIEPFDPNEPQNPYDQGGGLIGFPTLPNQFHFTAIVSAPAFAPVNPPGLEVWTGPTPVDTRGLLRNLLFASEVESVGDHGAASLEALDIAEYPVPALFWIYAPEAFQGGTLTPVVQLWALVPLVGEQQMDDNTHVMPIVQPPGGEVVFKRVPLGGTTGVNTGTPTGGNGNPGVYVVPYSQEVTAQMGSGTSLCIIGTLQSHLTVARPTTPAVNGQILRIRIRQPNNTTYSFGFRLEDFVFTENPTAPSALPSYPDALLEISFVFVEGAMPHVGKWACSGFVNMGHASNY